MTISSLFEDLDAPLNNKMWSWGAVREADKSVFLRVWQDGTEKLAQHNNKYFTWLSSITESDKSLGANERRKHVDLILKEGYKVFMIMCQVEDENAESRSIKDFDANEIRVGGKIIEHNGSYFVENIDRISVHDLKIRN